MYLMRYIGKNIPARYVSEEEAVELFPKLNSFLLEYFATARVILKMNDGNKVMLIRSNNG